MKDEKKPIKLRRALILGNFYNQKVKIIQGFNESYETIVDAIVGIKPDLVLTKTGRTIPKTAIKTIYPL